MKAKRKSPRKDISTKNAYLLLIAILIFSSVLSLVFYQGLSLYGDDPNFTLLLPSIYHNFFNESTNIYSLRPAFLYPFAFFSKLFNFSTFGAGFYSFICYLFSIVVTFLIGREIHSNKGGLLGSFIFAIYPGVIKANGTAGEFIPVVFFLGLAVLLFIYGKKSGNKWMYAFSGASTFIGALINPLAYVYFLLFFIYIMADFVRCLVFKSGNIKYEYLVYFAGFVAAVLLWGLVNLHLAYNGNPFYEFTYTSSFYAYPKTTIPYPNTSLSNYVDAFFPYSFNGAGAPPMQLISGPLWANEAGFFGYFAAALGVFLLAIRERKYYFLLFWAAFVIGYLEFGTMSIMHYQVLIKSVTYLLLVAMPIALVVGIGTLEVGNRLDGKRALGKVFVWSVVIFLFATALPLYWSYYIFNYYTMIYPKMIAASLVNAPALSNSSLYGPYFTMGYVIYYMGYPTMKAFGEYGNGEYGTTLLPTCSSIPNGSYIIIPDASTLSEINSFVPFALNESWVADPSECNFTLYADLYNYTQIGNINTGETLLSGNIYYKN